MVGARALAALVFLLVVASTGCGGRTPQAQPTATGEPATPKTTPAVRTSAPPASGFDQEAWRRETIERFGPEREFADGSKLDYVEVARQLCATEDRPAYEEGSLPDHMEKTFCPHT